MSDLRNNDCGEFNLEQIVATDTKHGQGEPLQEGAADDPSMSNFVKNEFTLHIRRVFT